MGSCGFSKKLSTMKTESTVRHAESVKKEPIKSNTVDQKKEAEKFKDFEEYDNQFSNFGIKKMKAYKSTLPYDELQKLKAEFWATKKENKRVWQILKQCCETDAYTAKELLSTAQLEIIDNCMNTIIDQTGTLYNLPNFLINDPLYLKEFDKLKNNEVIEAKLAVFLLDVFDNKQYKIEITNTKTGNDLKNIFCDIIKIPLNDYKIRLLCKGHEIQDDHFMHFHNIDETNNRIQVTYRLLEKFEKDDVEVDNEVAEIQG